MVDGRLLGGSTTEYLRFPCIKMTIEVNNRDRTISAVNRPEQWEDNGMITTQGDNPGMVLSVCCERNQRLTRQGVVPE